MKRPSEIEPLIFMTTFASEHHMTYIKPSYSVTGQYFMALNNIAVQNGPAPCNIFPALSSIALCDQTHNVIAVPTTVSMIFLNNSWNHSRLKNLNHNFHIISRLGKIQNNSY